jgi:hypothetical protein
MGGLVLGERQPYREETRGDASEPLMKHPLVWLGSLHAPFLITSPSLAHVTAAKAITAAVETTAIPIASFVT